MGGLGSTRWGGHTKATAVEDCRAFDLGVVARAGPVAAGRSGTLRWMRGEQELAAIGYTLVPLAGSGVAARLRYQWTPWCGEPRVIVLDVPLEPAPLPRGGIRWWGRCPLSVAGAACRRRVGKLYLAPGCPYFGCRQCHRLAYASSQGHDPRVDRLLADPGALARVLRNHRSVGLVDLVVGMKALDVLQRREDRWVRRFEAKRGRQSPRAMEDNP